MSPPRPSPSIGPEGPRRVFGDRGQRLERPLLRLLNRVSVGFLYVSLLLACAYLGMWCFAWGLLRRSLLLGLQFSRAPMLQLVETTLLRWVSVLQARDHMVEMLHQDSCKC